MVYGMPAIDHRPSTSDDLTHGLEQRRIGFGRQEGPPAPGDPRLPAGAPWQLAGGAQNRRQKGRGAALPVGAADMHRGEVTVGMTQALQQGPGRLEPPRDATGCSGKEKAAGLVVTANRQAAPAPSSTG